jgi:acyl carrier protein
MRALPSLIALGVCLAKLFGLQQNSELPPLSRFAVLPPLVLGLPYLAFLRKIQRPRRGLEAVDERTSLVETGLIDSLAVLEIVAYLESTYSIDFADTGVDPEQLTSIGGILDLIERRCV